jgi:hypothetical protein
MGGAAVIREVGRGPADTTKLEISIESTEASIQV